MMVLRTPNTGLTHTVSVWDVKKTTCGRDILSNWQVEDDEITCSKCLNKIFKRRKFTPARKFA